MDDSVSEEAAQTLLAQLWRVLQSTAGHINFAEGSDPVWNEAIRRLKGEIVQQWTMRINERESQEALDTARQEIDKEAAG